MNNNLKPIPFIVTKKKLREMYNDLSSKDVIQALKFIVEKTTTKNPLSKRSIRCNNLTHLEFAEFVDMYGTPKGYIVTEEFQQTLQQLKNNQDKIKIEKCIQEIRRKFLDCKTHEEKSKALQQTCFAFNLETSFIEKIIEY